MENDNAAYRNDLIRRKDLFIFTNATEEQIAHIPAVDAVEVVHAYWINGHESRYQNVHDKYTCSNCGEPASTAFGAAVKSRFCPWCGAKMDGKGR